jgi:hypothetical protein
MKMITRSIVSSAIGVGLLLAAASPASAAPVTVNQDPTTVKMVCDKYGGTYGPPGPESGGAVCLYPDGAFINCDKNNNCTHYPAGSRPNVAPPPVRPGSNGVVG